jgi:NAD(P)-dependent dehydrogenase (short-subunit alcohol dehydrogenase family)
MQLDGVAALVSGGGSGLGAATAVALAACGARVTVFDLRAEGAEAVAKRIGGTAVPGDVADEAAVGRALDAAEATGPLRLVVSCAGIGTAARILGRAGPHPLAAFEATLRVNLVGTFNLLRLGAGRIARTEPIEDGERGLVLCTASIAAFEGQVGQAAYAASKGGVVAMTLPASRELARFGIRVVTLAPGLFDTPLMDVLPPEARDALARQPLFPRRLGRPEEFADLVVAVARNPLLNGETIRLDGALRLPPG